MHFGPPYCTAKIPGVSKGEQGGENELKVTNRPSSPEPLKQQCNGALPHTDRVLLQIQICCNLRAFSAKSYAHKF